MPPTTVLDVVSNAMIESGILAQGETASAEDADFAFKKLNRLVDSMNARGYAVYVTGHNSYAFAASQQSYTIGRGTAPVANFVADRPVKITAANLIVVAANPDYRLPLSIIEVLDYAEIPVPAETGAEPHTLYYQPTWPNGTLWPWPYPENAAAAIANKLELFTWTQITAFTALTDTFSFPPGYEDAITLSLAEILGGNVTDSLKDQARKARMTIQGVNSKAPKLQTRDSGMPGVPW